jgi:hypothetical protein
LLLLPLVVVVRLPSPPPRCLPAARHVRLGVKLTP